jgi:hypothetical protein
MDRQGVAGGHGGRAARAPQSRKYGVHLPGTQRHKPDKATGFLTQPITGS